VSRSMDRVDNRIPPAGSGSPIKVCFAIVVGVFGLTNESPAEVAQALSSDVPGVMILATGGTIAGRRAADRNAGYTSGVVSIEEILEAVPGLDAIASIDGKQVANIGSQDMNNAVWQSLVMEIDQLRQEQPDVGIVITHGTDTMEETAFFLDLLFPAGAPIVLTGAMRSFDQLGADGPANLKAAVRVAASKEARDRGVLIVMHGEVHAARDVRKQHTENLQAFSSGNKGLVGVFVNETVLFIRAPRGELARHVYRGAQLHALQFPKVGILFAHSNFDAGLVELYTGLGYDGLVLAGTGNGNGNAETLSALAKFAKRGVVVRSTRLPEGFVSRNVEIDDDAMGFVASYDLSPQKSRILLQRLLTITNDVDMIQSAFACRVPLAFELCLKPMTDD